MYLSLRCDNIIGQCIQYIFVWHFSANDLNNTNIVNGLYSTFMDTSHVLDIYCMVCRIYIHGSTSLFHYSQSNRSPSCKYSNAFRKTHNLLISKPETWQVTCLEPDIWDETNLVYINDGPTYFGLIILRECRHIYMMYMLAVNVDDAVIWSVIKDQTVDAVGWH